MLKDQLIEVGPFTGQGGQSMNRESAYEQWNSKQAGHEPKLGSVNVTLRLSSHGFVSSAVSSVVPHLRMWSSIHATSSSSTSCSRYLLTGDASSGKSSLAMNLAHDSALATGGSVLYVCRRPADPVAEGQQQRFPLFIPSSMEEGREDTWEARGLANIHFKYVSRCNDLIDVLSRIALYDPLPSCLIIDDLSLIIDPTSAEIKSRGKFFGNTESSLEVLMLLTYAIDDAASHIEKVARAREEANGVEAVIGGGVGCIRLLIVDSSSDLQRTTVASRVVDASLRLQRCSQEEGAVLLLAESQKERAIYRYTALGDGKTLVGERCDDKQQ